MTRQTNMNEAKLIEQNQQWETHWTFLRDWLNRVGDGRIIASDAVKVMDELRPRGDEQ